MRFLRLDYRDDLFGLDLHPLISVVTMPRSTERDHLLEAVRRIANGSTGGIRGLVEHQGLLVELGTDVGEPLHELSTSATVVLHVDGLDGDDREAGLCREIDRWERQAAIDSARVEEIRSHLDLSAKARAEQLRDRLDPGRATPPVGTGMGTPRVRAVRAAFDAVGELEPMIPNSAPEIVALIERWEHYQERRSGHDQHLAALAGRVAAAERAVALAAQAVKEANEEAKPALLGPDDEARLDELHHLSNESTLWRKGLNSDEAAEMMALLNSVGVTSYTEYLVARMSPTAPPDKLAAIEAAEAAFEASRAQLERARIDGAEDEIAIGLRDELRAIKAECRPYLGVLVPSDLGGALRQQLEMVENPDWVEAVNGLRDALASNDLHPPGGFEPGEVIGWTDSWLRAQESMPPSGRSKPEPVPVDEHELRATRLELDAELQVIIRHERALGQIDRAEHCAARSRERVQQLRDQLRDRSGQPAPVTADEVMTIVEPVAEQILNDIDGSVPLAIVGEFPGLAPTEVEALLEAIEEMAKRVQIVLVTENEDIADWAGRVGLTRADLRHRLTAAI